MLQSFLHIPVCHDAIVNISFIAAVFNVPKKEKEGDTILSHSMEAYELKKTPHCYSGFRDLIWVKLAKIIGSWYVCSWIVMKERNKKQTPINTCFNENRLEERNVREDIALFRERERFSWIHDDRFLKAGYRSIHFTMIAKSRNWLNIPNLQ